MIATFDFVPENAGSSSFGELKHENTNDELTATVENKPVRRKSLLLNTDMTLILG